MVRKALLVLSGNATTSLLTFARNLLIARLISVEDFGIASTLALAVSIVEMASALGLQQQIVQSRDGDDPRMQAALQGFQLLRGVLSGLTLFLLAGPLADFMNVPEATWGYRMMALLPVLNALQHFDAARLVRSMRFGPSILLGVVPATVSLAATWPLARWLGDWRAMMGVILIGAALGVIMSHLVAQRPYRIVFDRSQMSRSLSFGWPLLINNVLLFLVFNGDRMIVGRELGMAALGIFSMGVTLTLTPTLVLTKSAQTMLLPQLSRLDRATPEQEARFQHLARVAFEVNMMFGTLVVVAVAFLGAPFIDLVLGPKFAPLVPLLTWLAVVQGVRVLKGGPSVVALARGSTTNGMIANLVRVALLPVAWLAAIQTGEMLPVITIALAGELAGFGMAMWLAQRTVQVSLKPLLAPACLVILTMAAALDPAGWLGSAGLRPWSLAATVLLLGATLMSMRDLRTFMRPSPSRS